MVDEPGQTTTYSSVCDTVLVDPAAKKATQTIAHLPHMTKGVVVNLLPQNESHRLCLSTVERSNQDQRLEAVLADNSHLKR